jgi:hypothetical protein
VHGGGVVQIETPFHSLLSLTYPRVHIGGLNAPHYAVDASEGATPSQVLSKAEPPTTAAVEGTSEEVEAAAEGSLEDAVLENSNQFYRWHSELEAARVLETEEKHQEYAESLRGHIRALDELQKKVRICCNKPVGGAFKMTMKK